MKLFFRRLGCICINIIPFVSAMQQPTLPTIPAPIWGEMNTKPNQIWWKTPPNTSIIRENFFQDIVGMDEQSFREHYNWNKKKPFSTAKTRTKNSAGWIADTPKINNQFRRAAIFQGTLNIYSIKELDKLLQGKKALTNHPYFSILLRDPWAPWESDIRYLQSYEKNAVFQIASTNTGPLEGGMALEGSLLTEMLPHAVQGEEASVGTAGATIWRKYLMGEPIHLQEIFERTNDYKDLKLGLHSDVVVTSGYGDRRDITNAQQQQLPIFTNADFSVDTNRTQIVTQVFTYGLNVGIEDNPDKAQNLLKAAYEGTLKAAIIAKKARIFLTLIGGGAFRNDIQWIAQAINNQECINLIKKYGLQVTIIFYPDPKHKHRSAETDALFFESMLTLFSTINGSERDPQLTNLIKNYLQKAYNRGSEDALHADVEKINEILMAPARSAGKVTTTSQPARAVASSSQQQPTSPLGITPTQQTQKTYGVLWKLFEPKKGRFQADNFYLFRYDRNQRNWIFTEQGSQAQPKTIETRSYSLFIKDMKDDSKPHQDGYAWVSEQNLKAHLFEGQELLSRGGVPINLNEELAIILNDLLSQTKK